MHDLDATFVHALTQRDAGEEVADTDTGACRMQRMPEAIADYTCRYEIRATADGCRLDWSPRASVAVGAERVFGGIVDGGWAHVAEGLTARFPR